MQYLAAVVAAISFTLLWLTHPARGMTRLLAPDIVAIAMLASIFAIRPFVRQFTLGIYGQSVSSEYIDRAIGAGTLGMVAFTVGCLLVRRSKKIEVFQVHQGRSFELGVVGLVALSLGSLALYIVLLTAIVGPTAVVAMSGGRSSDVVTAGVPAIVMMIPLAGPVAGAALILAQRPDVKFGVLRVLMIIGTTSLSIAALSQLGNRRFIIPAALIPVLASVARRKTPVRVSYVLLGIVGLLIVAVIPMVRSSGARREGESFSDAIFRYANDQGFLGIVEPIFASNDTEMLDFLGLVMQRLDTGMQSFGWGRGTAGDFLVAPLPASVFNGTSYADEVLIGIWGGGCGQPACPVASVVGVAYFDAGLMGVIVACLAFGVVMRLLARNLASLSSKSNWTALATIVASSYSIVLTRTNTINAIWWVLYTLLIAAVVYRLSTRRGAQTPIVSATAVRHRRSIYR